MNGSECRSGMHVVQESEKYDCSPEGSKWTAQSTEEGERGWQKEGEVELE